MNVRGIHAMSRASALDQAHSHVSPGCLMVDTFNGAPTTMAEFRSFNPFCVWPTHTFPVPGRDGCFARSVEGIWQGLKIVRGETDFGQFDCDPQKRPSDAKRAADPKFVYRNSRFQLGEETLDLITARLLIYLPTYLYLLDRVVSDSLVCRIRAACCTQGVIFYDWDDNFDILDDSRSFSHSAILSAWFRRTLVPDLIERGRFYLKGRNQVSFDQLTGALLGRYHAL